MTDFIEVESNYEEAVILENKYNLLSKLFE